MTLQQAEFIVQILTLVVGIVCAVFAGLALRQRVSPLGVPSMAGVEASAGRAFRRLPRRAVVWGLFSAAFFAVTIYLMFELHDIAGPPGPPGPQGPPGVAGAQGPPGQPDAATAAEMRELARAYWLNKGAASIKELSTTYSGLTDQTLAEYTDHPDAHELPNHGPISFQVLLRNVIREITIRVKSDLGDEVDLGKHPDFDLNHFMETPEGSKITDARMREDYTRLYDQFTVGKATLRIVTSKYQQEADKANESVGRWMNQPAK